MKNWVSIAITAVVALAIGYSLRPSSPPPASVTRAPKDPGPSYTPDSVPDLPKLPDYPKPTLEAPTPTVDENVIATGPRPEPLVGDIPVLPNAGLGGLSGSIDPLAPDVPIKLRP
ncbi:hypothetical protein EON82_12620, partial [bacterium]